MLCHFDRKRLNGRRIRHLRKNKESKVRNHVIFSGFKKYYILLITPMFKDNPLVALTGVHDIDQ